MDYSNRFLLIMIAEDNHLSNVKTLQSVFCQTYPNLHLLVCNDASDQFQGERLLYSFWQAKQGQKVTMAENRHPLGYALTVKKHLQAHACDYVMVLRAGQCLTHGDALKEYVNALECSPDASVAIARAQCCGKEGQSTEQIFCQDDHSFPRQLPDGMFVYRANVLREWLEQTESDGGEDTFYVTVADALRASNVIQLSDVLCQYREDSPKEETAAQEGGANILEKQTGAVKKIFRQIRRRKKLMNWLFKQSRFRKLLIYLILALQLLICALLFFTLLPGAGCVVGILFAVVALLAFAWCAGLVLFNLYFRKYPERLLTDDE